LVAIPGARLIADIVHLLDPVAYAASLVCILAACAVAAIVPAFRAARVDPAATLRAE
jgi:ABC-type antimicrobial peptide transport system permease subunit